MVIRQGGHLMQAGDCQENAQSDWRALFDMHWHQSMAE